MSTNGANGRNTRGGDSARKATRHARRRLWRWRHNPLRRREDVVEAWIVLVTWLVVVVGGAIAGTLTALAADREFAWQRADRQPVRAVLADDSPRSSSNDGNGYREPVKVRWTAPDGTTRTGRTLVATGLDAGASVTVWQNGRGALTTEPPGPTEARVEAALFGVSAALALAGLACGTSALARWRLDRRRYDQWGAEWDLIGPRWDQKTG
ncbi:hypothetical protein [Streptomyces sp. NPDC004065]|uniref:Rv1733c family protein n=1 Tax=Streptomyces sp. NPDC004065 TaxID=3364689 RepID=UPI00385032E3